VTTWPSKKMASRKFPRRWFQVFSNLGSLIEL
jgi:hypothetical protein